MQEMKKTRVQPLGRGDHQEEEMATDSSILAWRIPGTEEPGGLQSTGPQRVGLDLVTKITTTQLLSTSYIRHPLPGGVWGLGMRTWSIALKGFGTLWGTHGTD